MADHPVDENAPLLDHIKADQTDQIHNRPKSISNGSNESTEETDKAGADEENQQDENRGPQYEGMPEVKAKLRYILPAISIGIFLAAADQTIIVSCYGKIGSDLNALNKTSWISTAYFLTLTSFQPLYGKLSDIFGRKAALLFAYSIFGIGCLLCGLARTMDELIAARAFAGIGGGGMTTVVSILMSDIVPLRERGTWQGIINIIYASGAGCGAPLGGILADYVSWRWAFLAQAPMCALAIASVGLALRLPQKEVLDWKTKFRRIDFLGALVLVAAVFALLLGLDRGSNVSWSSNIAIASLCASVPLTAAFLFVEFRFASEPFAPSRIIFERSLIACYLVNFFSFACWMGVLFYLPLFFQAVDELSASQAGVRLLPAIAASVTGSLSGGLIMQKTGKYYWLTVCAYSTSALAVIPIILCTGLVVNNTYGISTGLVFSGFGTGIGVTTSLIGLIANASPEDQAIATACSYLFRSLGSVVGLSIAATVVQQSLRIQLENQLNSEGDAESLVKHIRESLGYVKSLSPEVQVIVRQCYGSAIRYGFVVMLSLACCAAISSWFIREKKLSR
ncbi:MAG: hypothetical protein Q9164_006353 [Protoblastenia rupestris]